MLNEAGHMCSREILKGQPKDGRGGGGGRAPAGTDGPSSPDNMVELVMDRNTHRAAKKHRQPTVSCFSWFPMSINVCATAKRENEVSSQIRTSTQR